MVVAELKVQAKQIAREMRAIYFKDLEGSRHPIAINTQKFANSIGTHLGYKITSRTTNTIGKHILAMIYREETSSHATVLIADINNDCWKRFTYMKEICHLYIDKKRTDCAEAEDVAMALLERGDENGYYKSEVLAAFTAIEIMIPEHLKDWMAHEANTNNQTPYQIAYKLKTPRKYVESKMHEWGLTIHN